MINLVNKEYTELSRNQKYHILLVRRKIKTALDC